MQARALTEDDLSLWRARMPWYVPRVLLPAALGCLVVVTGIVASGTTITAEATQGWASPLGAAVFGTAIATAVMLPVAPRVATWFAAVVAAAAAMSEPSVHSLSLGWVACAAVALLIGLLRRADDARQAAIARGWGERVIPGLGDRERRAVLARRVGPVLLAVLLGIGAGASLQLWHSDRTAVDAFRAKALVAQGTVVALDTANGWAEVAVGDRVVRAPSDSAHAPVGAMVGVRYAPDGSRAELLDQAFDPSGALILTAGCLVVAAVILVSAEVRRRERRETVTRGAAALRFRVGWVTASEWPRDDTWPAMALDLYPSDEPERDPRVAVRLRVRSLTPDESRRNVFQRGAWVRADTAGPLTDAALLRLAHNPVAKQPPRPRALPATVVVLGLVHGGSPRSSWPTTSGSAACAPRRCRWCAARRGARPSPRRPPSRRRLRRRQRRRARRSPCS
jgi:hypothetical protein